MSLKEGLDPTDLAQAGWGAIFARDSDPAVKEALGELLTHRRFQATRLSERRFRVFDGANGYLPGESKSNFLTRHGAAPGRVDPDRMPYYLLLVGDPETLPYGVQLQLDIQHAVGRINFATLEEYANYSRSVVAAEAKTPTQPHAAFFAPQNPDDQVSAEMANALVRPIVERVTAAQPTFSVEAALGNEATKSRLVTLLSTASTPPALLFIAGHGILLPSGNSQQLARQGAILCQDWPGPRTWRSAIPPDFYFAAEDVPDSARLLGTLTFLIASNSAGSPRLDDFAPLASGEETSVAPRAFVAALPQRLLSHPNGGALAVLGQVGRSWGYALPSTGGATIDTVSEAIKRQTESYGAVVQRVLEGQPIGAATELFIERYAELSTDLTVELETAALVDDVDDLKLAAMWTAQSDARAYSIVGDPAVRIGIAN